MNEDAIAAQLASTTESSQPIPSYVGSIPNDDEINSSFVDKLLPEERLTQAKLMDFLSIPVSERHNPMVDDYIQTIYAWARDTAGSGDYDQLLRVINEQEMHMGSKLKPDRMRRLAEYVKISKIRQQLVDKERSLYY